MYETEIADGGPKKTIVIADDDADFRQMLDSRCRGITEFDCHVIPVEDALTALCTADFGVADLVILDVDMPGSGLAACEMLAHDATVSDIPVIILTGRTDRETVQRCQLMGAIYLAKSPDYWSRLEKIILEQLAVERPHDESETRLLSTW